MRDKLSKAIMIIILALLLGLCGWYINMEIRAKNADYIVRVSFTGLENLFHDRYEYYAVNGIHTTNVSQYMKKFVDKDQLESIDIYNDEETNYWFVTVDYRENENDSDRDNSSIDKYISDWEYTNLGNKYRVEVDNWTRLSDTPNSEVIENSNTIIKALSNNDIDGYYNTHQIGNLSFTIINNSDKYLVEYYNTLYEYKEGNLVEIMECPESGNFNYWYFTGI